MISKHEFYHFTLFSFAFGQLQRGRGRGGRTLTCKWRPPRQSGFAVQTSSLLTIRSVVNKWSFHQRDKELIVFDPGTAAEEWGEGGKVALIGFLS